jgi:tRNA nucleotidyltransferase (CCA-adding enzyme)
MVVRDLTYVEDVLIGGLESFMTETNQFCNELQFKATGLAAAKEKKNEVCVLSLSLSLSFTLSIRVRIGIRGWVGDRVRLKVLDHSIRIQDFWL